MNGRFGSRDWTPIRYIHRSMPAARLSALYRDADVGVVTPLRDGMNLVAKEFVASQVEEPGVLVLSRLAGAAETMLESLLVNPYNTESVVEALHQALVMPVDQREARMRALQQRERKYDLQKWLSSFLSQAASTRTRIAPVRPADFESWLGPFLKTRPLLLFLDFDGTLAKIASHPSKALLAPSMRAALEACAKRSDTRVAIISGRGLSGHPREGRPRRPDLCRQPRPRDRGPRLCPPTGTPTSSTTPTARRSSPSDSTRCARPAPGSKPRARR